MQTVTFPMLVIESKMITPNVRHIALQRRDGTRLEFIPGQFITIHFEMEGKEFKRSYSIASIPSQSELIEFAASYFPGGPGTEYLYHLKPGDEINVSGPFGRLILKDEHPQRYILVATGTGVTPYRAMLPQLEQLATQGIQTMILLGVKNRSELLYAEDFIAAQQRQANLIFRAQYSRELSDDAAPYEYQGYVQSAFPDLQLNPTHDVIYLCGNPKMIDDAFAYLKEAGFESGQVRREKYVSSPAK